MGNGSLPLKVCLSLRARKKPSQKFSLEALLSFEPKPKSESELTLTLALESSDCRCKLLPALCLAASRCFALVLERLSLGSLSFLLSLSLACSSPSP